MGMHLSEHAADEEFGVVNIILNKAFNMGLVSYAQIFMAEDSFTWLTLPRRLSSFEPKSEEFIAFIDTFNNDLHSKVIGDVSFDEIDADRITKDKAVIKRKLVLLEKLMMNFLHIEEPIMERCKIIPEQFISEDAGLDIEPVRNDMDFYDQMLNGLEGSTIKIGSKLLNPDNRSSLLTLVACSAENERDLDE